MTTALASPTSRAAWRTGAIDAAPFVLAVVPFGLAIGTAGATTGLSLQATMFGAMALLAGASQLAATEALADDAGLVSVVAVVVLLNARFVLYGTGVSTWFVNRSRRRRLLLAVPIIDQTFLLCSQRFTTETDEDWREGYFLGATGALATAFIASQALGHSVGAAVPAGLGLHLAAPLVFTGMLSTALADRAQLWSAIIAASLLVAGTLTTGALGLPLAVVGGIVAGTDITHRTASIEAGR